MNKYIARGIVAGALILGAAGGAMFIPNLVAAADPGASPVAAPAASPSTSSHDSTSNPANANAPGDMAGDCMNGGPGGPGLHAEDLTAAAQALGMSEADLTTALQNGQSLADVASAQGVDVQNVIDAIVAADTAKIQADVDAGTITQAQADQRLANLTAHVTDMVNRVPGRGGPGGPGGPGAPGLHAEDLTAAAQALGMSEADLTTALQNGQSLADVASAQGVDVQNVIDAIVAADTAKIQADVDAGTITQAQADQRLANLTAHVTDMVNGVPGRGGPGGPGGPGAPGRHGQPPSDTSNNPSSTDSTTSSNS